MAFVRVNILFFIICATLLVGVSAHAKPTKTADTSVRIGLFNSQKEAQLFFESLPSKFQAAIEHKQLWLNAHQNASGFTEHHLEISGLAAKKSKRLCTFIKSKNLQCLILIKTKWRPSKAIDHREKTVTLPPNTVPQTTTSIQNLPRMLEPLGLRFAVAVESTGQGFEIVSPVQTAPHIFDIRQNIAAYGADFSLTSQALDTLQAQAAKAAYDGARNNFLAALQKTGDGINAGNGGEAARESLMALGQDVFEAAGSAYLSGFLAQEPGHAETLSSAAGAGKTFVHHVKKNLKKSARTTIEDLVSTLLSSVTTDQDLAADFLKEKTDAVMLSGARGIIDAGLAAARRSDLHVLRTLELEYNLNNFEDSYLSVLATQPVYQTPGLRHNIFLQGGGIVNEKSIDIDDDTSRHTLNLGVAYRYLTVGEKYLLGGNIFFDHQWPYNHSRMSLGIDAKAKNLNLAANYYRPLSDFKNSRRDKDGLAYEERALEGYDIELGYALPLLPDLSVFGKGYQYFRKTDDDIRGLALSAEYKIRDHFMLKGALIEENGGRDGIELALQYRMPLYDVNKPNLALANMAPAAGTVSLRSQIFEKVRRENRIRVEERLKIDASASLITAQFNALSIGLPFDVGGAATGALVNIPFNTAITIASGDFGIIDFSNGAIANLSASGAGDVIIEFNASTLTMTQTGGGFVQFISASGGISVVNVPGGTVNLLGTDIDISDDGVNTTIQVRAGQIEVVPDVGVDVETGNQGDIIDLVIATGATSLLVDPALETRQESVFTNLDLVNPDPPGSEHSAPFVNVLPTLITGPQFVGNNADLRLTFTQPVTVAGAPQIEGFIDANARSFIYNAGASTPSQLVFRHVFIAADAGAAGITANELDLNGGTIIGTANSLNALTAFTDTVLVISDQTAPGLTGSTPADEEPLFSAGADIVLTFDENVQAVAGNITITDTTDGSSTQVIPIGDAQITIVGSTITIDPTAILDLSTAYDLTIPSGVIEDTSGNAFAGIATGALNFTTSADVIPPTFDPATDSSPADNDIDVVLNENIVITFSEPVNKIAGNIEIYRTADDALLETIDVTTGLVTGDGTATITVNPANDYPPATDVYILIDAGAFEDLVGNSYAGLAVTTAFNFRGFAPLDVPGILLWLDAHDLDGDGAPEGATEGGLAAGDAAVWEDKSGNNNDLSHGTASRRPTLTIGGKNGRDILNFDGGDALYATDANVPTLDLSNDEFTMLVVVNPTNTGSDRILINKETSYEIAFRSGSTNAAVATVAPGGWAWGGTANNAITTAWHTVEFDHNNTTWDFYQDGVLTESIAPAGAQTGNIEPSNNIFTVGARGAAAPGSSWFLGNFAEVLMFDHALTAPERADLESYLIDKWGL